MRKHRRSIWTNAASGISLSALFGIICSLVTTMLFSLMILKLIGNMQLAEWFNAASCVSGSYAGAYFNGKHRRKRGLAEGIICGLLIYAVLSAAALLLAGNMTSIKKLLLLTASGGAGGVYGVNSKRPKNLMN